MSDESEKQLKRIADSLSWANLWLWMLYLQVVFYVSCINVAPK